MFQVNFSSGRYFSVNAKEAASHLPFDTGFEVTGVFHNSMLSLFFLPINTFGLCILASIVYDILLEFSLPF